MPDEKARLDQLVRTHLPAALRFAVRLTGSPGDAEDLVQEALLKVVKSWGSFREESSFRTWFYRIVINANRDRQKKRAVDCDSESAANWVDVKAATPCERSELNEVSQLIAQKIAKLPERQREVIVLSVYERMSVGEIARTLSIRNDNVHATLYAARKQLRTSLGPQLGGRTS